MRCTLRGPNTATDLLILGGETPPSAGVSQVTAMTGCKPGFDCPGRTSSSISPQLRDNLCTATTSYIPTPDILLLDSEPERQQPPTPPNPPARGPITHATYPRHLRHQRRFHLRPCLPGRQTYPSNTVLSPRAPRDFDTQRLKHRLCLLHGNATGIIYSSVLNPNDAPHKVAIYSHSY